jgi:hypothetical protein
MINYKFNEGNFNEIIKEYIKSLDSLEN